MLGRQVKDVQKIVDSESFAKIQMENPSGMDFDMN